MTESSTGEEESNDGGLTLSTVTVEYTPVGEPEDIHVHFPESGGIVWFDLEDGVAQNDGHVHSVDREKAEEAVANLPFVDEVDMEWTGAIDRREAGESA